MHPAILKRMFAVEKLGRRFGMHWVFRHVCFTLQKGDVLLVTGENGSGKSTLLRIAAGLIEASEGTLHRPPQESLNDSIGYFALDMSPYPYLSAVEHLALALRPDLQSKKTENSRLLMDSGLSPVGKQPAVELSTGMQSRLKLCLALQHQPKLLILDEPSAGLDHAGRNFLGSELDRQKERGVTILATNDERDAEFANLQLDLRRK